MPLAIPAMPDGGSDPASTPEQGGSWTNAVWAWFNARLDVVPGWLWVTILAGLALAMLVTLPLAKRFAFKAGARSSGKLKADASARRDRMLLVAVLLPAVLFWLTVLIGSGRSLTAFGREDLGWTGGWQLLVPFTLDGVAVVFGGLAFRALAKKRNPDRAYRVVWIATGASAFINFFHEVGGSTLGAGYLSILSLFGMLIFHELLAQFEEGTAWIHRTNPKFGLRWITWPSNTACAWVAWRNYPPSTDLKATIGNAVTHLETVRSTKTRRRAQRIDSPVWWMRFTPWVDAKALRVALETERQAAGGSVTKLTATVSDLTARVDRQAALLEQERVTAATSAKQMQDEMAGLREQYSSEITKLTAEADERLRQERQRLTAEMAAKVASARAEASLPHLDDRRNRPSGGTSKRGSSKAPLSDEAAVQRLLSDPGDPDRNIPAGDLRDWSQRAVVEALGVGYGRAPRLVEQVTEAQQRRRSETDSGDARRDPDDDAKERAS